MMGRAEHFASGAGMPPPGPSAPSVRPRVENHRTMSMDAIEAKMHGALAANDDEGVGHYADMMGKREQYEKSTAAARGAKRDAVHAQRSAHYDSLVSGGSDEKDAYSTAFGVSPERMNREQAISSLGGQGHSQATFNSLSASSHRDLVHQHFTRAENDTNGYMLSKEGERKGTDPRSLWHSNESTARKHASPELKKWWDENGRVTLAEHRADLLDPKGASRMRSAREDFHR